MNRKHFPSFLFFFILICKYFVYGHEEFQSEYVTDIHDGELDKFIQTNEVVLAMFYAPWCGHCKRLLPEFVEAGKILSEKDSKIKLAKIDATVENALAQEYGISGYPTLIMFNKTKRVNYGGGRTASSIVEWLLQMTGPVYNEIEESIEDVISKNNIAVAFYLEYKSEESDLFKKFTDLGEKYREMAKFYTKKVNGDEKLYCYRNDEGRIEYDEKISIEDFMSTEVFPLFGAINTENYRFYADSSKELVWVCATNEQFEELKAEIRIAANELRKKVHFVLLNIPEYTDHAKASLGLSEFPSLAFQSTEGRYILPNPKESLKDHKEIVNFFKNVEEGKIPKSLRSEPIPTEDKNAPVKVVVGDSFMDIVFNSGKDVLLEIYAPWCGHCKKLEPIYEELGRKLKPYDSIIIAKMDGTLNESPVKSVDWSGFPTIYFIKAGSDIPLPYEGERTLKGFIDFLNKHATNTPFEIEGVETDTSDISDEL